MGIYLSTSTYLNVFTANRGKRGSAAYLLQSCVHGTAQKSGTFSLSFSAFFFGKRERDWEWGMQLRCSRAVHSSIYCYAAHTYVFFTVLAQKWKQRAMCWLAMELVHLTCCVLLSIVCCRDSYFLQCRAALFLIVLPTCYICLIHTQAIYLLCSFCKSWFAQLRISVSHMLPAS